MKDVFRSGASSKKFKIADGQWYRYAPSYVSPAYHLLAGFPFIQEPPSGDLPERVLIRHHDYDQCFQSVQLLEWNSQVKCNVTVYRTVPTPLVFFSSRRRHTRFDCDWSSDVCSSDLTVEAQLAPNGTVVLKILKCHVVGIIWRSAVDTVARQRAVR